MRSYNHGVAETEVDLGGIVGAVAARARAMTPEFDPGGFLEGLSGQLQGMIPHDRVTVLYLDDGGRTVSVFAEHTLGDAPRHDGRYTLSLARASRYPIAEAVSSCVLAGQAEFVRDTQSDVRFMAGTAVPAIPQRGVRAWMALPLMGVERVIGAQGELPSLRRLQAQPAQRGRSSIQHLRRFISTRSGRKAQYARALVLALDLDRMPRPLDAVLGW